MNSAVENSPENTILRWWQRFSSLPAGSWLFSYFLGWYAPYSGTIGSRVEALQPGFARVSLRDRRRVRNHLKSIHAIALMNLGEITTGLAVLTALPPDMRGIVLGLKAEYLKKSRGTLTAEANFKMPAKIDDNTSCEVKSEILDEGGDLVAVVRATWLLGFKHSA